MTIISRHHGGLYKSLSLLFEKRLGYTLYRPIGLDWFDNGYWKIAEPYNNAPETIGQFLGINHLGFDSEKNLNGNHYKKDGIYHVRDVNEHIYHHAVTLDKFKEMQFDIIISSYQPHDHPYEELRNLYHPDAKLVAQVGNSRQDSHFQNILASIVDFFPKEDQQVVYYHQEFDLEVYKRQPPRQKKKISSFINMLPEPQLYQTYKDALPDYEFKAYGSTCPDGIIGSPEEIVEIMADSLFGWHIKPVGDGFGHIIHNWFAVGRPVILWKSPYFGQIAEPLMVDGETCINLEEHTMEENINLIRKFSEPDNHIKICQTAYAKFKEIVDYDKEAKEIQYFLDTLV